MELVSLFVCIVRLSLQIKKDLILRRPHPSVILCLSVRDVTSETKHFVGFHEIRHRVIDKTLPCKHEVYEDQLRDRLTSSA